MRWLPRAGLLLWVVACESDGPGAPPPTHTVSSATATSAATTDPPRGTLLSELTWLQAEAVLTTDAIVVLPLGAAAKEHGPHLRLDNDWLLAEYFKQRVLAAADVVVAPTLGYHFYPAFVEYPGSTTLSETTARDVVVEIVASLAAYGPRRFYVLNTGISTVGPLRASAELLAAKGILLRFTDIAAIAGPVEAKIAEQPGGSHADELETSIMLYIAPHAVDMTKAVRDWAPKTKKGLSRSPDGPGHYSKSGVWGDPTLATLAKGETLTEAMVAGMLAEIEALRTAPLPEGA